MRKGRGESGGEEEEDSGGEKERRKRRGMEGKWEGEAGEERKNISSSYFNFR